MFKESSRWSQSLLAEVVVPKVQPQVFPTPSFCTARSIARFVASLEIAILASNRAAWCGGRRVHGGVPIFAATQLVINAARLKLAMESSNAVRKAMIPQLTGYRATSPIACAPLSSSPRPNRRRLRNLRHSPSGHPNPHPRDPRQLSSPVFPLPGHRGRCFKDLRRVPDLGRRCDVLHLARRTFDGAIVADGTDGLFSKKAAVALL